MMSPVLKGYFGINSFYILDPGSTNREGKHLNRAILKRIFSRTARFSFGPLENIC